MNSLKDEILSGIAKAWFDNSFSNMKCRFSWSPIVRRKNYIVVFNVFKDEI